METYLILKRGMTQGKKNIYTLGTSNRTLEEFLEILQAYGIGRVVDVRRFPTSSRYPWFNKEPLSQALKRKGISYHHLGEELGGYRRGGYQAFTQTPAFQEALKKLEALALENTTAIICAERLPWRCHRRFITQALEETGWRVVHILEKDRTWQPSKEQPTLFPREEI